VPPAGHEPAILAHKRPQIHALALDRAGTRIGIIIIIIIIIITIMISYNINAVLCYLLPVFYVFSICCLCFSDVSCAGIGLRLLCQQIINKELIITNEVEQWYVRHSYLYCLIT